MGVQVGVDVGVRVGVTVGVSVGACTYPDCGSDELELRERADLRMYEAKRAGGNRYVL